MNLLNFFFIVSWLVFLILALDVANKQKLNIVHFLSFLFIWAALLVFTFYPNILDSIWNIFWVARWADVLVYCSIIFLLYTTLRLYANFVESKEITTELIRNIAIENSDKKIINSEEIFVIPSYNEWQIIKETIDNLFKNWYKNILIVNDWSKDNSRTILEKYWEKIILLNHLKNRGQWASLETGFEYVRIYWNVEYIVTYDADWQHDIKDYKKFKEKMKKNQKVDILLWSRFLWNKNISIPFVRKIILKMGIYFTYIISNIYLTDTHNWYRVIRKRVLDKIRLKEDGMSHASEILDIISVKNIKYKEVPVTIKYTEYSLNKWQSSRNAINIAIRMIWSKFFK